MTKDEKTAAEHWHTLYLAECLKRQDDAARYGQEIVRLESVVTTFLIERRDALAKKFADIDKPSKNYCPESLENAYKLHQDCLDDIAPRAADPEQSRGRATDGEPARAGGRVGEREDC